MLLYMTLNSSSRRPGFYKYAGPVYTLTPAAYAVRLLQVHTPFRGHVPILENTFRREEDTRKRSVSPRTGAAGPWRSSLLCTIACHALHYSNKESVHVHIYAILTV